MNATATSSSVLTERYVWAAVRTLPVGQRSEIEPEIRSLVGDAVAARAETGLSPVEAERQALQELGDPERLAAGYAERPLQLIGPRFYLEWWNLLRVLLAVVVPIVGAVVLLAAVLADEGSPGSVIGQAFGAALTTGLHVVFWTTLAFALLERHGSSADLRGRAWTPEELPALPARSAPSLADFLTTVAFLLLAAGALVWQAVGSPVQRGGEPVPLLQAELWSFWLPYVLALLGAEIALESVKYLRGGWSWALAGANAMLNLAFAAPVCWLASEGRLLNPSFFEEIRWPAGAEVGGLLSTGIVVGVGLVACWDVIDGFLAAHRQAASRNLA